MPLAGIVLLVAHPLHANRTIVTADTIVIVGSTAITVASVLEEIVREGQGRYYYGGGNVMGLSRGQRSKHSDIPSNETEKKDGAD